MAKITKETIKYIAELARLKFNEADAEKYAEKMGKVIKYVEKLNELNTEGIEPTSHALSVVGGLQEDEVRKFEGRDELLKIAPELDGDFYQVPKVV